MARITQEGNLEDELSKMSCKELLDHAQFIDIFDERLDIIMRIVKNKCSEKDLINLRQLIRIKLIAYEYDISPQIITRYGIKTAYLINQLIDHRVSIESFRRALIRFIEINNIKYKADIAKYDLKSLDGLFDLSQAYVYTLDKIGILEDADFYESYSESLIKASSKLNLEKSFVAFAPVVYSTHVSSHSLENLFKSFGKNFYSLKGVAFFIGIAIIKYFADGVFLPSLSIILDTLKFDADSVIKIFELAKTKDQEVLYRILNQMIYLYFEGNVNDVLEDIMKGVVQVDYVVKALMSTSFAMMSRIGLENIFEFLVNISDQNVNVSYYFGLLSKIISEVKPIVLRMFLTSEKGRELVIKLIERVPQHTVLHIISRMISVFVPYSFVEEAKFDTSINKEVLEKYIKNWDELLTKKVILYLGLGK